MESRKHNSAFTTQKLQSEIRDQSSESVTHISQKRNVPKESIPEGGLAGIRAAKKADLCLQARGLCKSYRGSLALSDVSLELQAGEIFGLMGPNGAGKTTLLRILATLTKPDSGLFSVKGTPHTAVKDIRRNIGFTNDVLGVYDDMLVTEYLNFFARASGVDLDLVPYTVQETLEMLDLLSLQSQPVDGLSRGMKQRLAFARAIIAKPSLLLLDEPASGLDPLARLELKELLLRMAREGTTIILSSHVLEDLAEVSHRIGVLRNGVLVKTAETQELIKEEGSRRFRVRATDNEKALFDFLESRQDTANLRWDNQDLVFRWVQSETDRAHLGDPSELLTALVLAGCKIRSFTEEKASLENAYLHLAEHSKGKIVV